MTKYSFNLHWSDEDGGYIVRCQEFPGLSAFGESPDEAIAEAQIAMELMIETYEQAGQTLPDPRKLEQYSGQFRVRIPKSLHRQAAELAAEEGVSMNTFVHGAIAAKVGWETGQKSTEKVAVNIQFAPSITINSITNTSSTADAFVERNAALDAKWESGPMQIEPANCRDQ